MKMVKLLLLVSLGVLLSGCNTTRGIGADLEVLGRKMQGLNNDDVMVAGNPPQSNVVQVPSTYRSEQSYDDYQSNYSSDGYSSSASDFASDLQDDMQVYTTPYEDQGSTTYSDLPDAITYPVE